LTITLPPGIDLGKTEDTSQQFKTKLKVHTIVDNKWHTYFTSFSFDSEATEYMATAELKAPYSNDLMEYWAPISTECVVYGANKGKYKILYVGRVREIKQDGYSVVISLQSYGWKFEQTISAELAEELVGLSCDVVFKIILDLLKIPSYTLDEKTEFFLQQYALDENGEVVKGNETMERIPDLINRIGNYYPTMTKNAVAEKLKEDKTGNIKNINYTLQYEEPTPTMKKLKNESTADPETVAQNSSSTTTTTTASQTTVPGDAGLRNICGASIYHDKNDNRVKVDGALCTISRYCAGKLNQNNATDKQALINAIDRLKYFYNTHGKVAYNKSVQPWLNTVTQAGKGKYDMSAQRKYLISQGLPWT